jgi:hypothetical protein
MNKEMKKNLEAVINSLVNEDTKSATEAFHNYLQAKTQTILMNESPYDDEDSEEFGGADGRFRDDRFDDEDQDNLDDTNTDFGDEDFDEDQFGDDEDFNQKRPESRPDSQEITDRYNDPRYVGH